MDDAAAVHAVRDALETFLATFLADQPRASVPSLAVAFSGGRDSTVLLHALMERRRAGPATRFALRALHVNHGLHPGAGHWQAHCAAWCQDRGVPFQALAVTVTPAGQGLEAAAREARYQALAAVLAPGELLLTAHHRDDQLETVLLHLMRGSGVEGLAGIPAAGPLGPGRLVRPLLGLPGAVLAAYGRHQGLSWVSDPANADERIDRNFLRHRVIPLLAARWPDPGGGAGRSAALSGEAAGLLAEMAGADARRMLVPADGGRRLHLEPFRQLSPARQRNLIRHLARQRGWGIPPERRLRSGLGQLLAAPAGRHPVLAWPGGQIRRFRGCLYFLDAGDPVLRFPAASGPGGPGVPAMHWTGQDPLCLGPGLGRLCLVPAIGAGLAAELVAGGLTVDFGPGPESLRPPGDPHHRRLKFLFQRAGIVPWMRGRIPRVRAAGRLIAVGDLWLAADALASPGAPGFRLEWTGHGPLY